MHAASAHGPIAGIPIFSYSIPQTCPVPDHAVNPLPDDIDPHVTLPHAQGPGLPIFGADPAGRKMNQKTEKKEIKITHGVDMAENCLGCVHESLDRTIHLDPQ